MKFLSRLLTLLVFLSSMLLLQGCFTAVGIYAAACYKIYRWEGDLEGDRFRLIQDAYLYQSNDKNKYLVYKQKKDGTRDHFIKMIPKDSIFTIVKVENENFHFVRNVTCRISPYPIEVIGQFVEDEDVFSASIFDLFISRYADKEFQFFADPEFLIEI